MQNRAIPLKGGGATWGNIVHFTNYLLNDALCDPLIGLNDEAVSAVETPLP